MKIPYVNLGLQHQEVKKDILSEIEGLLDSGSFILGEPVNKFETDFAALSDAKHAIGVSNGTISLTLCLQAIGIQPDDEVITTSNSYLASASSVVLAGATPVFADVDDDMNISIDDLQKRITPKTKAIIAVHLTGRPADMDAIMAIANEHNIIVIEDAAQAVGAKYKGRPVGSIGHFGSFSLHPLKNLGACGDAGIITTNDDAMAEWLRKARTHGMRNRDECDFWSYNARIDAMQAAILNVKMKHLSKWNNRRIEIANAYNDILKNYEVIIPVHDEDYESVYHAYIIQTPRRDELMNYLLENGIDCKIHYPIAIHQQKAAISLGVNDEDLPRTSRMIQEILSIPVHHNLTDNEVEYICSHLQKFFNA